ncbi:McrC family protein [Streptomyces sp. NPDC088910]|uniref:McrC family protein n=2 Tax=unclassified Streptomyces TaxID=2593676 RepID=UPI00382C5B97
MPDLTAVRLGEYESTGLRTEQLTPRDVDRLQVLQERRCLTLDRGPAGWRLKADATVGVLALDHVRLVIEPKFAISGERLMTWLAYALDAPTPLTTTTRRWSTGPDGYADLVAAALLEQCQRLLREGLRHGYVRHQSIEPVLRGRLDFAKQISRRYGQLDQLHIRTFDRETDIWDNRVLGTALRAALALVSDSHLARELRSTASAFPQAATPGAALRALDRVRYTRLNSRYRAAHTWARLLLRGGGVTDLLTDLGTSAEGLLLRMPALWEAVVRRLTADAASRLGGCSITATGRTGITVRGDLGSPSRFRPDVLLSLPGPDTTAPSVLPVDAKYKRYDRHGVSAGDVHQLLTYSAGYASADCPRSVIVHPQTASHAHRTLQVRGPDGLLGVVQVLGVGTSAHPEEAAQWIASTLARDQRMTAR